MRNSFDRFAKELSVLYLSLKLAQHIICDCCRLIRGAISEGRTILAARLKLRTAAKALRVFLSPAGLSETLQTALVHSCLSVSAHSSCMRLIEQNE